MKRKIPENLKIKFIKENIDFFRTMESTSPYNLPYETDNLKMVIFKARRELDYSQKTFWRDIYFSLYKSYKKSYRNNLK